MAFTIQLSPGAEISLREQATARGQDVREYAAELLERAISARNGDAMGPERRMEFQRKLDELLHRAAQLAPTLTKPPITDFRTAFGQAVDEKARRQGLEL